MRSIVGVFMLVMPLLTFALIIRLWPPGTADPNRMDPWQNIWPCGFCDIVPFEPRMLMLVLIAGAMGSSVQTATSYASYVGSRKYLGSWSWWYLLRIPIGMGLALILYFALRGGFFSPTAGTNADVETVVNPFGFVAIASLAGMFSRQATDKLRELFDGLFKTEQNEERTDKLATDRPMITTLSPASIQQGSADTPVKITGKGFVEDSTVDIGGVSFAASYTSPTTLSVTIPATLLSQKTHLVVKVVNSEKDGAISETRVLEVL